MSTKETLLKEDSDETAPLTDPAVPKTATNKERIWVVVRCSFIASLASMLAGMSSAFTSPALMELSSATLTPALHRLNSTSILPSVFGALELTGAMFGSLLVWPVSDCLGRRPTLTLSGVLFSCGWLLISYSTQIIHSRAVFLTVLLTGRFVAGAGAGWSLFSSTQYISEISSPLMLRKFDNLNLLLNSLGYLLTYFLGVKFGSFEFDYSKIALIAVGLAIIFEFLMLVATYESPRWLFSKKMDCNATKILTIFRGKDYQVDDEIKDIKANLNESALSIKQQFLALKSKGTYYPLILVAFVVFFQQFNGISAVLDYASQIFVQAGYDQKMAKLATLLAVGVVKVLATVFSNFLIDCTGRRAWLTVSSIGVTLSSILLGIYFFIFEDQCNSSFGSPKCPERLEFIAVSSIIVFIATHSIGWSPVGSIVISELLPNRINSVGSNLANALSWFFAAIVSFVFYPYSNLVTVKFTWWTYAGIAAVSIAFVILFLEETKKTHSSEARNRNVKSCLCCKTPCTSRKKQ